jgi:hypothetical protein
MKKQVDDTGSGGGARGMATDIKDMATTHPKKVAIIVVICLVVGYLFG